MAGPRNGHVGDVRPAMGPMCSWACVTCQWMAITQMWP